MDVDEGKKRRFNCKAAFEATHTSLSARRDDGIMRLFDDRKVTHGDTSNRVIRPFTLTAPNGEGDN